MKYLKMLILLSLFTNLFCMEKDQNSKSLRACFRETDGKEVTFECPDKHGKSDEYLSMMLYGAALKGRTEVVRKILTSRYVDVNYNGDPQLNTPLIVAIKNGHQEIAIMLLEHPNIKIDLENYSGETPFFATLESGCNINLIRILINKGADVRRLYKDGTSFLTKAVTQLNFELIKILAPLCPYLITLKATYGLYKDLSPLDISIAMSKDNMSGGAAFHYQIAQRLLNEALMQAKQ